MPARPPVPNVIRSALTHTRGGDNDIIVGLYWYYASGTPTASGMTALAGEIASLWASEFAPLMVSSGSLTAVTCTDLATSSGAVGEWTGSHAGTRSGSGLAAATSLLLNYAILRRYRGGKPRSYWPFGVDGDLATGQTWASGLTSAMDTAWQSFASGVIGYGGASVPITQHANVSYYEGFTAVENPVTGRYRNISKLRATPLVDYTVGANASSVVASQRRRNRATGA